MFPSGEVVVDSEWQTGALPDRTGASAYVVLIRAPDDPQRAPRERGSDKAPHLTLRKQSLATWRDRIAALLDDGKERTFNAICVELCGLTADICFDEKPEHALWSLVGASRVAYSVTAPIKFRIANDHA
ncbi:MAG: hypothetical protein IT381_06560 [Deltaproteobacteria bacterium]|nr:hypothetical protein [Deltaproteobacteria bacterium]